MHEAEGELVEIWLEKGELAGRMACDAGSIPAPGQYMLANRPRDEQSPLAWSLFQAGTAPGGVVLAPPLAPDWLPGMRLALRVPLGHGFKLPEGARRVALAAWESPARLLPLAAQALAAGAEVTLFCAVAGYERSLAALPVAVEVAPLNTLSQNLGWADFLACDLPGSQLDGLRGALGLANAGELACPAQALLRLPMPCAGLGECGVCAVPVRRSGGRRWKLACQDGPVFDLAELEW